MVRISSMYASNGPHTASEFNQSAMRRKDVLIDAEFHRHFRVSHRVGAHSAAKCTISYGDASYASEIVSLLKQRWTPARKHCSTFNTLYKLCATAPGLPCARKWWHALSAKSFSTHDRSAHAL